MKDKQPRAQVWDIGNLFAIPLRNGTNLLGQVVAREAAVLNSVSCALFDQRFGDEAAPSPVVASLFAVVMTTRDLLDNGVWKIVGTEPIEVPRSDFPYEALRPLGFLGAKVIGSKNVAELANAFCGLVPWDDWADPEYLDRLLVSPEKKPKRLIYKKR